MKNVKNIFIDHLPFFGGWSIVISVLTTTPNKAVNMTGMVTYKHYSFLLPEGDFTEVGPKCYNLDYANRRKAADIELALERFDELTQQGIAIEGGITREEVAKGNFILPLDELAEIVGSRNEVLGQFDKRFDGYILAGGPLFDEYDPECAAGDYDGNGTHFETSKRIMQDAATALKNAGIDSPRRIDWPEVSSIFNTEFIDHWATGISFAYDDGRAPETFNLGFNEVALIFDWGNMDA